jgi:flagellar basal body-associated protein FliL
VKRLNRNRILSLVFALLLIASLLSACNKTDPRVPKVYTYSPGAAFSTNINDPEPRRVLKCVVLFEVIDEDAVTELTDLNFIIRNACIAELSSLTLEELTINRNIDDVSQRLVDCVNAVIPSNINLVVRAYFTDFLLS